MHLLCCQVFVEAHLQCFRSPTYSDSKANHLADDLSRDDAFSFLSKVPSASAHPSPVSTPLLDLLLDQRADWTSQTWRQPFRDIFRQVWHNPRRGPTYGAAMKRFNQFCCTYSITDPFPISELTLYYFVSYLRRARTGPTDWTDILGSHS